MRLTGEDAINRLAKLAATHFSLKAEVKAGNVVDCSVSGFLTFDPDDGFVVSNYDSGRLTIAPDGIEACDINEELVAKGNPILDSKIGLSSGTIALRGDIQVILTRR